MNPNRSILIVLSLALIVSCGGDDDASSRNYDEEACHSFVLPQRFGVAWEKLNHRISTMGLKLTPSGDEACLADSLEADFVGGDWSTGEGVQSDTPMVHYGYQVVDASPEFAGVARYTIERTLEMPFEQTETIVLNRRALNLTGYTNMSALSMAGAQATLRKFVFCSKRPSP